MPSAVPAPVTHARPRSLRSALATVADARPPRWLRGVLLALLVAGAACRVRQYAERMSFWGDEAFIVLNVTRHTARELPGHLQWDQAAPPLFLWAERGLALTLGTGECAMRLPALLCGLTALALFALLARRLFVAPVAILAVGLFAFCQKLIEYAAEVKQYSGDTLVAVLLLFAALGRRDVPAGRRLAWAAGIAAVAAWFSHTTVLVFGGVSLTLSLECLRREGPRGLARAAAWNVLAAGSFVALYFVSIRHQHSDYLYQFWAAAFPDPRRPWTLPGWFARQTFEFAELPYRSAGLILLALAVAGAAWLAAGRAGDVAIACLAPVLLTALAACARQYPYSGSRLSLFLLPGFFLLAAAGAALAWELVPERREALWWAIPAPLLVYGLSQGVSRFITPHYRSHVRPAVAYVKAHRRPDEAVCLVGQPLDKDPPNALSGRHVELLCYWQPPPPLYTRIGSLRDVRERRFWVVAAIKWRDDPSCMAKITDACREFADQKDEFWDLRGGVAFLFERR